MLSGLQALYDQHRYLDAWNLIQQEWKHSSNLDLLSVDELIFAGRMALRLGGPRLARKLFRTVRSLAPDHPRVRYFTDYLHVPRRLLLDELVAFEAHPDLDGDAATRANWKAQHATTWARLRNQPRALELMRQAHALLPEDCWLHSVEADVWGLTDDWAASLRAAEQACALDPRSPWANISLASALMNTGSLEQAVAHITASATDTQSGEMLQIACWYQCAWAEFLAGEPRRQALEHARHLVAQIEPLSPLADREFKAGLARIRLDIAQLANDQQEMELWAQQVRSPFHRHMLANLKQNPHGQRIQLSYRRPLQKHNECVPTSVSSALSASNIEVPIAEFAAEVTYGGTAEWAAADWLRSKKLHTRFFSATAETTWRLLSAGIGFMVTWPSDDGGHAVAIVGMDQAAGIVLAHDPNSLRTAEYLLRAFNSGVSPYGVLGMAAVREQQAAMLDSLLPPEAVLVEAAQAHQRALLLYGPSAARDTLTSVALQYSEHPALQELIAIQDLEEGRTGKALAAFQALLQAFPRAPRVRSNLIVASRALGNTALLRATLRTIVETGALPGTQAESTWIRPHPRYVAEYADLLRGSRATIAEAETLLRSVLRADWSSALAWHVLADLRWDQRRVEEALLAYRIASFLAPHHEHYAHAYVVALAHQGRADEGFAWLRERTERIGGSLEGVNAWVTWIGLLETRGHPERALATYEQAVDRHPSSVVLLAFAAAFLARMGRWEEGRARLELLAAASAPAAFHEAAVAFHRMLGEPRIALQHAQAWVDEVPRSMPARYAVLSSLRILQGNAEAATRAGRWLLEHPANEDFEVAFCEYAQDHFYWRKIRMLRRRVQRNADDGWAWRELVFAALTAFEKADPAHRRRMTPRIESWFAEARRVSDEDVSFLRAQALWQENRGHWGAATDAYLKAIALDPENFFAYRRAWECSARLPEDERRNLWADMELVYLGVTQALPHATEMMGLLAGRWGVPETEAIVDRWRTQRPDDANVLEAAVDLWLEHERGRSASTRALPLLEEGVRRFPYHAGLQFSLARCYRALGDNAKAHSTFTDLVRRVPNNTSAMINLAWIEHRDGDTTLALQTLAHARVQTPRDPQLADHQAQILVDAGRLDEAMALIEEMIQTIPDSVQTYEGAIARFRQCGRTDRAVEAAHAGTRAFPRGAYLWLLLGRTLKENPEFAGVGEVESCLHRSLKHNATLYEAADWLAVRLVEQHRYAEASALLREIEPVLPDPSPALGRLAWIKHQGGEAQAAIEDMAEVLRRFLWYAWGWNRLLAWLDESKDSDRTRSMLQSIPPTLLSDTDFRQKRLELLDKANADPAAMEGEWEALLRDLPEDVPLHLRRFDALKKSGRRAEAARILRHMLPAQSENVYLLARLVDVNCQEGNSAAGLEDAVKVCFAALEESEWPVNQVWDHMQNAGLLREFAARFGAELKQGRQPTPRALVRYATYLVESGYTEGWPQWVRRSWFDPAWWRASGLIRRLNRSAWMRAEHMADLMEVLNKGGFRRLVLTCWRCLQARGSVSTHPPGHRPAMLWLCSAGSAPPALCWQTGETAKACGCGCWPTTRLHSLA